MVSAILGPDLRWSHMKMLMNLYALIQANVKCRISEIQYILGTRHVMVSNLETWQNVLNVFIRNLNGKLTLNVLF